MAPQCASRHCSRMMQIGHIIANQHHAQDNFTHALIAATPANVKGGIGWHTDRECPPGTPLLAVGLEGRRGVIFNFPEHGKTNIHGDYLALNGLHTRVEHCVETLVLLEPWPVLQALRTDYLTSPACPAGEGDDADTGVGQYEAYRHVTYELAAGANMLASNDAFIIDWATFHDSTSPYPFSNTHNVRRELSCIAHAFFHQNPP